MSFPIIKLIDSIFRIGKNYFHKLLLEECKYVVQEEKMRKYITCDIEIFSGDSDKEDMKKQIKQQNIFLICFFTTTIYYLQLQYSIIILAISRTAA